MNQSFEHPPGARYGLVAQGSVPIMSGCQAAATQRLEVRECGALLQRMPNSSASAEYSALMASAKTTRAVSSRTANF